MDDARVRRVELGELVLQSKGVRFEVLRARDRGVVGDGYAEEGGITVSGEDDGRRGKVGAAVA